MFQVIVGAQSNAKKIQHGSVPIKTIPLVHHQHTNTSFLQLTPDSRVKTIAKNTKKHED